MCWGSRGGRGRAGGAEPLTGASTDRGPLPACSASTPETWARFTQENLYRAERERLASGNLRVLIDCILRDTAEDLRLQCDAVNLAFERRCEELEDARHKLTDHLDKVKPPRPPPRPGTSHAQNRPRPHFQATPTPSDHAHHAQATPSEGVTTEGPSPLWPSPAPGDYALVAAWPGPCPSSAPSILRDPRGKAPTPPWAPSKSVRKQVAVGVAARQEQKGEWQGVARPGRAPTPGPQGGLCCCQVSPVLDQGWGPGDHWD